MSDVEQKQKKLLDLLIAETISADIYRNKNAEYEMQKIDLQNKIQSLEQKLEDVMSKVDTKDTAQLTKKVGGMDRQIAKLNKSIEKIASHVVEK